MTDPNPSNPGLAGSHRSARRAAVLTLALAALLGPVGCDTVREGVMNPCLTEQEAHDYATNLVNGMKGRGVNQNSPNYQRAVDQVERARAARRDCEARVGA